MSDEATRRRNLVLAIRRAFPGLALQEARSVADGLLTGELSFGSDIATELTLDRHVDEHDPQLLAFLGGMGSWVNRLAETVAAESRTLRWAPEHGFLYVLAGS